VPVLDYEHSAVPASSVSSSKSRISASGSRRAGRRRQAVRARRKAPNVVEGSGGSWDWTPAVAEGGQPVPQPVVDLATIQGEGVRGVIDSLACGWRRTGGRPEGVGPGRVGRSLRWSWSGTWPGRRHDTAGEVANDELHDCQGW
jgi:hypothetical protein